MPPFYHQSSNRQTVTHLKPDTPTNQDLLSSADLTLASLERLLDHATEMKVQGSGGDLRGKTLGLLFFDRSLRTRVSFEVAMRQLGGHCINVFADKEIYDLTPEERVVMDGRAEEHVKDAARTLSRYIDALGSARSVKPARGSGIEKIG